MDHARQLDVVGVGCLAGNQPGVLPTSDTGSENAGSHGSASLSGSGGGQSGPDDVVIAGAAAHVPFQSGPHFLGRRIGIALDDLRNRHDHAGGAIAALESMIVPERFLHGGEIAIRGQPLNGGDLRAIGLHRECGARLDSDAIHADHAGAALAGIAANLGSGEVQSLAKKMNQQGARFHFGEM